MTSLSKLLRTSCAIATSGALVLSSFPLLRRANRPRKRSSRRPGGSSRPPRRYSNRRNRRQQLGQGELEKLLAPIALYPDDLVAQILTAATYPIEVVEASRWVGAHPNLRGNALQDAMQQQPWDPSVKGLTAFPKCSR